MIRLFKMHTENQSLVKLRSLGHFLKISGRFYFQNYNLFLFQKFLQDDPEISIIIDNLLSRYPKMRTKFEDILGDTGLQNFRLNEIRSEIEDFDEYVAFCISYLKKAMELNFRGNGIVDSFIQRTGDPEDRELSPKEQFYNDCIEPILLYIELQVKHDINALFVLQRYKVLCEWFDRENLNDMKSEIDITKNHLSKFLFNSGFTYSLSETNVASGRIDNFAFSLGLEDKKELSRLPNAIIAEGKIFRGQSSIVEVLNQVDKRMRDLNFRAGYCVIFNKEQKNIKLEGISGNVDEIYFRTIKDSRIYFLIINLHNDFYESTASLPEVKVDISSSTSLNK